MRTNGDVVVATRFGEIVENGQVHCLVTDSARAAQILAKLLGSVSADPCAVLLESR